MVMSPNAATQPLISVALSVYNGERYLREQLDSLLAQAGVSLEVVAVDDGSGDGSLAVLNEYASRDARMRVFANSRNVGYLPSFGRAMSLCEGDYVAPCDQDDIWHADKLAKLLAAIGQADMSYCDSEYVDDAGESLGSSISDDLIMLSGQDPLPFIFQNSVSGHAMLVRRQLVEIAGHAPPLLYHDWWLALCAAAHNGLVYVDEPLVKFRRHAGAYSAVGPMAVGKDAAQRRKQGYLGSANRKWLEERTYLASALADTGWRGSARARDWQRALQRALERPGLPWRLIWRDRRSMPPWTGAPWINALQFYSRCKRKLRRARNDPPTPGTLFRL